MTALWKFVESVPRIASTSRRSPVACRTSFLPIVFSSQDLLELASRRVLVLHPAIETNLLPVGAIRSKVVDDTAKLASPLTVIGVYHDYPHGFVLRREDKAPGEKVNYDFSKTCTQ